MKAKSILLCFVFILSAYSSLLWSQDVLFYEGFEEGSKPADWQDLPESGEINWSFQKGGRASAHPDHAAVGEYNATFIYESYNNQTTKLVAPYLNLTGAGKPLLTFYHVQQQWTGYGDIDQLRIFYRIGTKSNSPWVLLQSYTTAVEEWTLRSIQIPDSACVDSFFLAFEGKTKYGNGTCIDEVKIEETIQTPRTVNSIKAQQGNSLLLATGSTDNAILRIDFSISGNTGDLPLQSIAIRSGNTTDADIRPFGVHLYFTPDTFFSTSQPLGSSQSFSGGSATFSGLNLILPFGMSSLWVTYDIADDAGENNIIDAFINAHDITIDGGLYPDGILSPPGNAEIVEKIYFEDFEGSTDWTLTGDFQWGSPLEKGGYLNNSFTGGNPDPESAFSGTKVIGNDLTGLGDSHGNYESFVTDTNMNYALSPYFDFTFYKDLNISFRRWLNVHSDDYAAFEASLDSGQSWNIIWTNRNTNVGGFVTEGQWNLVSYSEDAAFIERQKSVRFRFRLGNTFNSSYSGWNIDNFLITGNYITKDVGVIDILSPTEDCGHSNAEEVSVRIYNFGSEAVTDPIPVNYSFDGITVITEYINTDIDPGDSLVYTFSQKADLSTPDVYTSFQAYTSLVGDEDARNNKVQLERFYSLPYSKPPYYDDFEQPISFWRASNFGITRFAHGLNSPGGAAQPKTAPSGQKYWRTNLNNYYFDDASCYVESPCFDFTQIEKGIFESKLWIETEHATDGALLEYSLDNGTSWKYVPRHPYPYSWNWYDPDTIRALGQPGWDSISGGWITAKQFLPAEINGKPLVKFRFYFSSDSLNTQNGFAFDDVKVYEAPENIGVTSFKDLTDACQLVNSNYIKFYVKNFGYVKIKSGAKVYAGIKVNNQPTVVDTFTLAANLLVGDSVQLQFTKPVNLDNAGTYNITSWTMNEGDRFYGNNQANDTARIEIDVIPLPTVTLPDTIRSSMPDSIILSTLLDSNYDYSWPFNGSTSNAVSIPGKGKYSVIVTDTRGNGCQSYDTAVVEKLILNVGVDSILSPRSACELGAGVSPQLRIRNYGTDTLAIGDTIPLHIRLDNLSPQTEKIVLTQRFYPGAKLVLTSQNISLNLITIKGYNLQAYTKYKYDSIPGNDTTKLSFNVFGYPSVNLGPDTTIIGVSYPLNAGAGFKNYLWNNGDTTQLYQAVFTGKHYVRVTDVHNCSASDTTNIRLIIHDVAPVRVVSPVSGCDLLGTFKVSLEFENAGTDSLQAGTKVPVSYSLDSSPWVSDTAILSAPIIPGQKSIFLFQVNENRPVAGTFIFKLKTSFGQDIRAVNDTIRDTVSVSGYPVVNLGNDASYKAISHTLDAGEGAHYGYLWKDGSRNRTLVINQTGVYWVTVTDTLHGCSDRDTIAVTMLIDDMGVISHSGDSVFCSSSFNGIPVTIKNFGNQNYLRNRKIPVMYTLNNGAMVPDTAILGSLLGSGGSFTHTLRNFPQKPAGVNQIKIFTRLSGDLVPANDTLKFSLTFYDDPVVNLGGVQDTIKYKVTPVVLSAGSGFSSYLWSDGSNQQTLNATQPGWYWVSVTNEGACNDIDSVFLHLVVGVESHHPSIPVSIYPNPAHDIIYLKLPDNAPDDLIMEIINPQSQVVLNKKLHPSGSFPEQISLGKMSPGIYYLRIFNKQYVYLEKMIIE